MTLSNYVNQEFADKAAISLSGLCLLHCLALPILVAIYPVAFAVSLSEEFFHWAMVMMAIPISIASLFIGCQKHKKRQVLLVLYGRYFARAHTQPDNFPIQTGPPAHRAYRPRAPRRSASINESTRLSGSTYHRANAHNC